MAKLRFLEVASAVLFTSFVLWQATSSNAVWSTVTEETLTTTKGSVVCDGITCPPGQHCVLNTTENRPDCICSESCHEFYNPVCGSDGRTYIHDCDLGREACKNKTDIRIQYLGKCYESSSDGCDRMSCPPNEHCVMIQNTTQYNPECRCKESCPFIYDPVCGSDDNTYLNECRLRVEACYIGTNTTIKHKGTCKDDPNSCDAITCPPGQRCVLNATTNSPVCICKDSCTEPYDPVCGSDGQTYSHVCDLGLLACKTKRNITVHHWGECAEKTPSDQYLTTTTQDTTTTPGGCTGFECPYYGMCLTDGNNRPKCVCRYECPIIYRPVCGSNNQTYTSDCKLRVEVCLTEINITIQYMGFCNDNPNSCNGVSCPLNKYCVLNITENRVDCICQESCIDIYDPVCGSDGKTYVNDCVLGAKACKTNTNITIEHRGLCNGSNLANSHVCDGATCPPGRYCRLGSEGQPKCVCRSVCPTLEDPVCGSDGKTYSNECGLGMEACWSNNNITIQHKGICNNSCTLNGFDCPFYGECVSDAYNRTVCVCMFICDFMESPVCGSNHRTYYDDCVLWKEACLTKTNITIRHRGICNDSSDACDGIACPMYQHCVLNKTDNRPQCVCPKVCSKINDQVCGSDGRSYANDCVLRVKACNTNTNITIEHKGFCNSSSTCNGVTCPTGEICQPNSEGQHECVCPRICPLIEDPVCGSDGKTYGNECMLRVEACWSNNNITIKHKGICNDSCSGFECPFYGQCVLDVYNRTTCVCVLACPFIDRPVCGSDNKTYVNDCALRTESCRTNTSITFLYPGRCDGVSSCDGVTCQPGRFCDLSSDGKPECVCNETCSTEDAPICASNGKTYGNKCLFNLAACWYDNSITVAYVGKCKPGN